MKRKLIHKEIKANGTLKIWENKNSLYGAVYENNVKIMAASFKFADNDATIQRVKELFSLPNVIIKENYFILKN